ncbi:MAG: hypothetical protein U1E83_08425 [Methylotetracoccus sp.]
MFKTMLRTGVLLAAAVLSLTAQGHECRELGQPNQYGTETKGCTIAPCGKTSYFICVGFAYEDPALAQPGAGNPNNLDFFPVWIDKKGKDTALDTSKGDKVEATATLYYLNSKVYDIPVDENFQVTVPYFFFTTKGVGYESPIGVYNTGARKFSKTLGKLSPVPSESKLSYRAAHDFVLPYTGMYQWVLKGTLQKRGELPVDFETKWTCQQPRIPYGPYDPNDIENTLRDAPEGWFDCARYPANAAESAGSTTTHASPPMQLVMDRLLGRTSR